MNEHNAILLVAMLQLAGVGFGLVWAALKYLRSEPINTRESESEIRLESSEATLNQVSASTTMMDAYNKMFEMLLDRDKKVAEMHAEISSLSSRYESALQSIKTLEEKLERAYRQNEELSGRVDQLQKRLDEEIKRRLDVERERDDAMKRLREVQTAQNQRVQTVEAITAEEKPQAEQ